MADGTEATDLIGLLSDDNKAHPSAQKFKDVDSLFKSYTEMESMNGRSVRVPGPDAGGEAWQQFTDDLMGKVNTGSGKKLMYAPDKTDAEQMALYYETIGVPKDADGYDFGEGLSEATIADARSFATAIKASPDQVEGMVEWMKNREGELGEQVQQARDDDANTLRNEWGESTDQRKNRVESVLRAEGHELEGLTASQYLAFDALITKLQGKGPQGAAIGDVEVGPNVAELREQERELLNRLSSDTSMDIKLRRSLLDKRIGLLEQIRAAETA